MLYSSFILNPLPLLSLLPRILTRALIRLYCDKRAPLAADLELNTQVYGFSLDHVFVAAFEFRLEQSACVILRLRKPPMALFELRYGLLGSQLVDGLTRLAQTLDGYLELKRSVSTCATEHDRLWSSFRSFWAEEKIHCRSVEGEERWDVLWCLKSLGYRKCGQVRILLLARIVIDRGLRLVEVR